MNAVRSVAFAAVVLCAASAQAESVETAPGVRVTKKTFAAPANEQPFYGFVEKTSAMREADGKFTAAVLAQVGTKEKAFEEAAKRGWAALGEGKLDDAGRRFNQASLFDPAQSSLYHAWAIIVFERFKDAGYADELFKTAKTLRDPLPTLNADHGRTLLRAGRGQEAQPVLEQAVRDAPDFADAWANLGFARLARGDATAACVAATEAGKRKASPNVVADISILRERAACK